ncbi:MAG: TIGR04438 family Trp-rich protein [Burkholderiales bacterium]|nr:TIGR04438 family Trp-rich protein [Burkholderiales bacterium]
MWFIAIGCLFVALKLADLTMVAQWSWLWILLPFGLAAVWWFIADQTGLTKQREAEREARRVADRRERHLENMGLSFKRRHGSATGKAARPPADKH